VIYNQKLILIPELGVIIKVNLKFRSGTENKYEFKGLWQKEAMAF